MNILFVCSRNKWRSATAETIYQNHPVHQVRSAGTAQSARVKVNYKHINWADLIFVMEKRHRQRLFENFEAELSGKSVVVLDIADEYTYMDEELIATLETKVAPYL
ncbi:low molecular weight protein tyrosine phosphatase family protein [Pedobacter sp. ASV12]|uniref:low molecular weight protein tyrosine phosphatase family protein n=1 Tax=Pedobacter sp. ASV12 TaxID=2795120 RepID=UPI0018EB484B|nr:protein tyrosine phosphatase [Pedobacter sp. ASV12]